MSGLRPSMDAAEGMVFFVGEGTGDPDRLTARALAVLRRATLLVHDPDVSPAIRALSDGQPRCVQLADRELASELINEARCGHVVVRLTARDPILPPAADRVIAWVAHAGVPFEVVVGVGSALAATGYEGLLDRRVDAAEWARWFAKRPLFGKRVVLTRAREQGGASAGLLRSHGADPILFPTLEFRRPQDEQPLRDSLTRIAIDYDWVAFTSANGVHFVWQTLREANLDARAFGPVRIAAIGPGTASALEMHGLIADVIAEEYRGEALATAIVQADAVSGGAGRPTRILIPRALVARDALPNQLRATGCLVDVVAAYETTPPDGDVARGLIKQLRQNAIDVVTFTSTSTVNHFCEAMGPEGLEALSGVLLASIGPITAEAMVAHGLKVDLVATPYTIKGLVQMLEEHFRSSVR